MGLSFGNIFGFLALLGIPAVLVIHLFQRRSRDLTVSSLFLLQQVRPESMKGRNIERLRSSVSLWLQLLSVLVLTWLLVQPRWLREDSFQRVVFVLDSSASMYPFRDNAKNALIRQSRRLDTASGRTEWLLMESSLQKGTVYSGLDRNRMLASLEGWQPRMGSHNVGRAIDIAMALAGENGTVILVTDHEWDPGGGVEVLSVGRPVSNVGFTGLEVVREDGEVNWRVMIRNYSGSAQVRKWHLRSGDAGTPLRQIELEPGRTMMLSGPMPEGSDRANIVMEPDGFPLDDVVTVVSPRPKILNIFAGYDEKGFISRLVNSFESSVCLESPEGADIEIVQHGPGVLSTGSRSSVVLLDVPEQDGDWLHEVIVAEAHPYVDGLNWQGLLLKNTRSIKNRQDDEVILWQGNRPLVFVRTDRGHRHLVINISLENSNADRLPAFVLLVHRFVESVRSDKIYYERKNFENGQVLDLAVDRSGEKVLLKGGNGQLISETEPWRASLLRAPFKEDMFSVSQGGRLLLEGASHFADVREADFRDASSSRNYVDVSGEIQERNSFRDPFVPLWLLVLCSFMLADWYFQTRTG